MAHMINDPKVLILAMVGGIIPSLLWLWFWLKEDKKKPEPKGLIATVFLVGAVAVVFILPIEKFIQANVASHPWQLILWATAEEIIKYLAVMAVIFRTNFAEEPIDWPIYMITAALGFAALENALFLIKPLSAGAAAVSLLTGQLRFLGATLLHTVTSGILGIALGISLNARGWRREWHVLVGFTFAIGLHSVFNFFIMRNRGSDFLKVFAFLWVVTIIVLLLFERVRRLSEVS
jgi:RsiW-degrading membrane proteinase PrsW (M82 family)